MRSAKPGPLYGREERYLLEWQDIAFRNGYTAVADAGVELVYPQSCRRHHRGRRGGLQGVMRARWATEEMGFPAKGETDVARGAYNPAGSD